jgi:hypothetical protein
MRPAESPGDIRGLKEGSDGDSRSARSLAGFGLASDVKVHGSDSLLGDLGLDSGPGPGTAATTVGLADLPDDANDGISWRSNFP